MEKNGTAPKNIMGCDKLPLLLAASVALLSALSKA
jgi:hypothetical protein